MAWFEDWISRFLSNPGYNDALKYGVTPAPVPVVAGQSFYQLIGIHHLTGAENHGQHNVFVDVLNEAGKPMRGLRLMIQTNGANRGFMMLDKGLNEPGSNTQMHWNDTLSLFVEGLPSDQVKGLHTRHDDEEAGTTRGHHSYYVVWQKAVRGTPPPPDPTPGEDWLSHFDDRQKREIEFCRLYAKDFAHGTSGHNEKLIIAKMAELLDKGAK